MADARKNESRTGRCLCGAVIYEATGEVVRVSACYCGQCRVQNGGSAFHGMELHGTLNITQDKGLKWYDSSQKAERGFCADCGSSLFWRLKHDHSYYDVSIGTLDDISDLTLNAHIFVDSCAPYQTVPNNAPHFTEADLNASTSEIN